MKSGIMYLVRGVREWTWFLLPLLLASSGIVKSCVEHTDKQFREEAISRNIAERNYHTAHTLLEEELKEGETGLATIDYILNQTLNRNIKTDDAANYVRFYYQEKRADDFDIFTIRTASATNQFTTQLEKVVQDEQEFYAIADAYTVYLSNGSAQYTLTESNGAHIEKILAQNKFQFPSLGTSPSVPTLQKKLFVDINNDGYDEEILWKQDGWVYVFDGYTNARLRVISVGKPQFQNSIHFDALNGKHYLTIATDTVVYAIADGWLK